MPSHSAYIGRLTVRSRSPYIVYGDVRGLVGEHRTLSAAVKTADRDARDCSGLGGGAYSDARVYQWSDRDGWTEVAIDA